MASNGGIPNPSYTDGYNKQKALLYNLFSSKFDTKG